jgi:hypothetical protein
MVLVVVVLVVVVVVVVVVVLVGALIRVGIAVVLVDILRSTSFHYPTVLYIGLLEMRP